MIIVQLTGGLGNQLFQYSAAKALSLFQKTELLLDVSSFLRTELPDLEVPRDFELSSFSHITDEVVNINNLKNKQIFSFLQEKKIDKVLPRYRRSIYKEPSYSYDKNFFKTKKSVFLKGGWQSPKYFKSFDQHIKKILEIKPEVVAEVKSYKSDIKKLNTVGVHIRRGDYLRKQIILEWHGVMGKEYYLNAFDILSKKQKIDRIIYFSEDIEWIEKELMPYLPGEIISLSTKNHFEDFYLMQNCKHNIIANSSFSWWAAYLNSNPDKIVIAPKKWFNKAPYDTKDLFPPEWILI